MPHTLITSVTDGQKKQLKRFAEDAVDNAIAEGFLGKGDVQQLIERGGEFQVGLKRLIVKLLTPTPKLDCFAVADWEEFYGVSLTDQQLVALGDFPWSDELLNSPCPFHSGKTIRQTHFAFVGLDGMSILQLQKFNPDSCEPRFYAYAPDAWYSNEKFATQEALQLRWYLLLKDVVPNSENKTFDQQKAMLFDEYEVPSAVVETAKDFLIYKKTGCYANPDRYARTVSLDSDGSHVYVGDCDAYGVSVDSDWDATRSDDLGVGASRKLPSLAV